jgi:general nucleoside transport system permease protein
MTLVFEKRLETPRRLAWTVPLASMTAALLVAALLLILVDTSPREAYSAMLAGAFGSRLALTETLVRAIPLILTGLSVAVAFRMLFWNIGAEGQLVIGGITASGVALFVPELIPGIPQTPWVYLPLMVVAAMLAGALWGLGPALLKSFLGVNEIITTLMLNYIAILFYQYLFTDPWKDPAGFGFPGSAEFPQYAWLPRMSGRLHIGLFLGLAAAVLVWFVFTKTRWGYEITLIGENEQAARYAGVGIMRNIIAVMILSGGLAGLAGMAEVAGISHRLQNGLSVGNGFTGIIVAWLAKLDPLRVVLVAILMAALFVGGDQIQISLGLPASLALVLQGLILLFVLAGDIFTRYRLRLVRTREA